MKFFTKRKEDYSYEDDNSFYDNEYYGSASSKEGNGFDDDEPVETETKNTSSVAFAGATSPVALKVMKPASFEEAPDIADYIASGSTVLLNIENMDKASTKRMIDFLLGATHVLGGTMNMVTKGTFVFAPRNVGVADLTGAEAEAEDITAETSDEE